MYLGVCVYIYIYSHDKNINPEVNAGLIPLRLITILV